MAPAPKRKVEEPSSEYYSETPPLGEAGQEKAAEPEADYGGTDDKRQRSQSRSSGWQSQK